MRVVMITENDPAGMGIAFCNAINRYTDHKCRLITTEIRYNFMFEKDLHLPSLSEDDFDEIRDELENADILHFHMLADEHVTLGKLKISDFVQGKKIVHHHHGHPDFRGNSLKYREKYQKLGRQNLLVSTPDLLNLLPGAIWQPNLVPVNSRLYTPLSYKDHSPVLIAHSPTRKELKNTRELLRAIEGLKQTGVDAELRLIEMTEHTRCLALKRGCHILFDHLQGYFGVSSLEGLSQGLVVVAGLDLWNREKIEAFVQTDKLPWFVSGPETLEKDLATLVMDKDLRDSLGRYARTFMMERWSDNNVASHLIQFYEEYCQ